MDNQRKAKLEDVYRKHSKSLYHYLLRLSGSPSVAEDLVQETFYKATVKEISIEKIMAYFNLIDKKK